MYLPSHSHITAVYDDDPLPHYYNPLTGWAYRGRLDVALAALDGRRPRRCLEIGYGSGILLPELARRCDRVTGLDYHRQGRMVREMLNRENTDAPLGVADVSALPVASAAYDAVFCLSVLEHLEGAALEAAAREIARVVAPGGVAIVGYPVRNAGMDAFFRIVGYSPRDLHPSGHIEIFDALNRAMEIKARCHFPGWLPRSMALYHVTVGVRQG